ncbi:hypothetical protein Tco_1570051 [Tanacetum coccineum]
MLPWKAPTPDTVKAKFLRHHHLISAHGLSLSRLPSPSTTCEFHQALHFMKSAKEYIARQREKTRTFSSTISSFPNSFSLILDGGFNLLYHTLRCPVSTGESRGDPLRPHKAVEVQGGGIIIIITVKVVTAAAASQQSHRIIKTRTGADAQRASTGGFSDLRTGKAQKTSSRTVDTYEEASAHIYSPNSRKVLLDPFPLTNLPPEFSLPLKTLLLHTHFESITSHSNPYQLLHSRQIRHLSLTTVLN